MTLQAEIYELARAADGNTKLAQSVSSYVQERAQTLTHDGYRENALTFLDRGNFASAIGHMIGWTKNPWLEMKLLYSAIRWYPGYGELQL